jgi:hypothetical protein
MATNVLAIPKANAVIQSGTNEDWIDSICYLVGDGSSGDQLDLRGISFELMLRRTPPDYEVILTCSTDDGSISVGAPPNVGFVIFYVPEAVMAGIQAGTYVGDVRAFDGEYERVVLNIDFTLIEGVTR